MKQVYTITPVSINGDTWYELTEHWNATGVYEILFSCPIPSKYHGLHRTHQDAKDFIVTLRSKEWVDA